MRWCIKIISLNPASPANGTLVPKAGTVRFAVVDFAAGTSDVSVNTVKISKQGLNTTSGVSKVWFEKNGTRVSSQASFSSEGDAVISFAPAYVVKANETATLDLYVELSSLTGVDYAFTSTEIATSAAKFSGSFTTPTLRTADYTVAGATITAQNVSGNTYNANSDKVELGKFTVANTDASSETRDETFQTIMLYQSGAASLDNLSNIVVERNGTVVSSDVVVSGKTVAITLNDTIKDGVTATYLVKANIAKVELSSDVYQLYLKKATDINIIENKTGFRSTVSGLPTLGLYTVKGGDVTFSTDSATAKSADVAPGTSDVVLMKGTIEAKSAVNLEDVNLSITTTGTGLANAANTIYLQIGNSTFSATSTGTAAGTTTLRFNGSVTVDGTAAVKVYTKLKDASAGTTIKVSDMTLNSFVTTKEYASNQNTINSFVGTISGVSITVATTALNGTRVDGLGATNLAVGAKSQTIFAGKYSQTQGNAVNLSNFNATFAGTAFAQTGANVTVSLYVNGVVKSTKSVTTAGTYSFDGLNATVNTTTPATVELKADFNDAIAAGTFNVSAVSFDTTDSLTSANVVETALVGPAFTILAADAVLASSDNNPKATLLTSGTSNNKLFAFKLTAKNDTVKLKDITIAGTGLSNFSNFRLSTDGTDAGSIGVASTTTDSSVVFQSVTDTVGTAMDKSNSYYLIANANTNTNTGNIAMSLSSVVIKASNGTERTVSASSVTSKVHAIAENTLVVAKIDNTNKSLSTSAMRFTVTAAGKDSVTLSGFTFTQNPTGYTSTGTVKVYKDSVSAANEVTSSANNTVDAGSTVTFIAVVENATKNGSANTISYELKLEDVATSAISSVKAYLNTGAFPFVETISN